MLQLLGVWRGCSAAHMRLRSKLRARQNVPDTEKQASWKRLNPGYEYRFYTDAAIVEHVQTRHPEMMPAFSRCVQREGAATAVVSPAHGFCWLHSMSNILRADFFRYLVLLDFGGYYADIDVTCDQPIDEWLLCARAERAASPFASALSTDSHAPAGLQALQQLLQCRFYGRF